MLIVERVGITKEWFQANASTKNPMIAECASASRVLSLRKSRRLSVYDTRDFHDNYRKYIGVNPLDYITDYYNDTSCIIGPDKIGL